MIVSAWNPSMLDQMALPSVKTWMLVFTVIWFATVPLWMDRGVAS